MDEDILTLMIRNREEVVFNGQVKNISGINKKGKFDILPKHANFISLVGQTLVARLTEGQERIFQVENGVLRVLSNKVEVYLGVKTS